MVGYAETDDQRKRRPLAQGAKSTSCPVQAQRAPTSARAPYGSLAPPSSPHNILKIGNYASIRSSSNISSAFASSLTDIREVASDKDNDIELCGGQY